MTVPAASKHLTIALVGNPNTGKSTLFSALAGVRQQVGNYPGVTVEKKVGRFSHAGVALALVDLPGTYSLAPRSPDEMVAVDVLLGRTDAEHKPDAVLCIVDAGNLERNLYLVSQVLELGLPTIVALNMIDVAAARGVSIDSAELARRLGVPVVEVQAHRGVGLDKLKAVLTTAVDPPPAGSHNPFSAEFQNEVERLLQVCRRENADGAMPRYLAERLLLDTSGYLLDRLAPANPAELRTSLDEARGRLAKLGQPVPAVEAMARYGWVGRLLEGVVRREDRRVDTVTDRIDRVLTHRVWGTLIFAALMIVVFQAVFSWAVPVMDLIDSGVGVVSDNVGGLLDDGALRSLLVDGVLGGVGGVIIFLPQILVLFLFIAVLEDCGYMARAAYLMDKLMVRVGLSGKSFIPLLSSFACAIPGVMATRVIENRRDRLTTMLIAPLMSCSARLPVYTLMIAAFIPAASVLGVFNLHGVVMFAMYLVGILTAVAVAFTLKRTLLRGPTPPFVLELPSYKMPSPRTVLFRMLDRGWAFLKNAGTLIVAVSILVWALLYYPHDAATVEAPYAAERETLEARLAAAPADSKEQAAAAAELEALQLHIDGAYQRQSYLGRMGHAIEPLVRPLGWDWKIGAAAIASFPAREVVVATLGILYDVGQVDVEDAEQRTRLQTALDNATWAGTDRKVFGIPTALSIMVFFALCAQCAATLAVIKRETNSWRWPIFTFTYMTALAYVAALVTYQVSSLLID
ncbi:MAG: ferrous iron transport protein B [Planctomycetaceae bacterium]|nr:ferrous iron transport protein B [Planctomycetaceae bacterium]